MPCRSRIVFRKPQAASRITSSGTKVGESNQQQDNARVASRGFVWLQLLPQTPCLSPPAGVAQLLPPPSATPSTGRLPCRRSRWEPCTARAGLPPSRKTRLSSRRAETKRRQACVDEPAQTNERGERLFIGISLIKPKGALSARSERTTHAPPRINSTVGWSSILNAVCGAIGWKP